MRLLKHTQYRESLSDQIKRILDEENLQFKVTSENESETILSIGMGLNTGNVDCFIDIQDDQHAIEVVSFSPVHIPDNKRPEVLRYFNIVALHLTYGHFIMDLDTGRIRQKTYLLLPENETIPDEMIKRCFYGNLHTMDHFFPGVMQIVYGNLSAQRAIELIQNKTDPQLN